jgi:hypothetical protein
VSMAEDKGKEKSQSKGKAKSKAKPKTVVVISDDEEDDSKSERPKTPLPKPGPVQRRLRSPLPMVKAAGRHHSASPMAARQKRRATSHQRIDDERAPRRQRETSPTPPAEDQMDGVPRVWLPATGFAGSTRALQRAADEAGESEISTVVGQLRNELRQTRVFSHAEGAWVDGARVLYHVQRLEQAVSDAFIEGNIRAVHEKELTAVVDMIRRGFVHAYSATI